MKTLKRAGLIWVGLGLGGPRVVTVERVGANDWAVIYYDAENPDGAPLFAGSDPTEAFAEARHRTHFELVWHRLDGLEG